MAPGLDVIQPATAPSRNSDVWPTYGESRQANNGQIQPPYQSPQQHQQPQTNTFQAQDNAAQGGLWPPTQYPTSPPAHQPVQAFQPAPPTKSQTSQDEEQERTSTAGNFPIRLSVGAAATGRMFVAPFRGSKGASSMRRDVYYASIRDYLSNFNPVTSLRTVLPTGVVLAQASKDNLHELETVPLGEGARGHWLYRSNTKYVLLYFHGGGYISYMTPGHAKYLFALQRKINRLGYEVSIFALEYTMAPYKRYPGQMTEAVAALRYLLERQGRRPKHIMIAGDSAGGNLAAALLLHLANPHPSVPPLYLESPLRGALLISPLVSFDTSSPSCKKNRYSDIMTVKALNKANNAFLGESRQHDAYSEPLRAPVEWWQRVAGIVDEIMIWGGGAEIMIDAIREFAVRVEVGFERAYQQHDVTTVPIPENGEADFGMHRGSGGYNKELDPGHDKFELAPPPLEHVDGQRGDRELFKHEFGPGTTDSKPHKDDNDLYEEHLQPAQQDFSADSRRFSRGMPQIYDDKPEPLSRVRSHHADQIAFHPMPDPHLEPKPHKDDNDVYDAHEKPVVDDFSVDERRFSHGLHAVQPADVHPAHRGPDGLLQGHEGEHDQAVSAAAAREDISMIDHIIADATHQRDLDRNADAASDTSDYGEHMHPPANQDDALHSPTTARNSFGIHSLSRHSGGGGSTGKHSDHRRRSQAVREEDDYLHTETYNPGKPIPDMRGGVLPAHEWPRQDPRRRVKYTETPRMCHEEMIVDYILRISGKREGARSIERWFETLLGPDRNRASHLHVLTGEEQRKRFLKPDQTPKKVPLQAIENAPLPLPAIAPAVAPAVPENALTSAGTMVEPTIPSVALSTIGEESPSIESSYRPNPFEARPSALRGHETAPGTPPIATNASYLGMPTQQPHAM